MAFGRTPWLVRYCGLAGAAFVAYTFRARGIEESIWCGGVGGLLGGIVGGVIDGVVQFVYRAPVSAPPRQFKILRPRSADVSPVNGYLALAGRFLAAVALFVLLVGGAAWGWPWVTAQQAVEGVNPAQIEHIRAVAADQSLAQFVRYFPVLSAVAAVLSALTFFPPRRATIIAAGAIAALLFLTGPFTARAILDAQQQHQALIAAGPTLSAQQRAVKLYPDLAVANSRLNREFLRRYQLYQKENPAYFHNPEWPTALAGESQATLPSP